MYRLNNFYFKTSSQIQQEPEKAIKKSAEKASGDNFIFNEKIINLPLKVKTDLLNIYNEIIKTI